MTRDDAAALIELCRDGEISEHDARRLAEVICEGGSDSRWILQELEMSGLIAHAIDTTDVESFLRGFWERITAERSNEQFVEAARKRMASRPKPPIEPEPAADVYSLNAFLYGRGANIKTVPCSPPRRWTLPLKLMLRILAATAAVLAAAVAAALWPSGPSAVIATSGGGVVVTRGDREMPAESAGKLRGGDRVHVPAGREAVLSYKDGTLFRARQQSDVLFEPPVVPVFSTVRGRGRKIFVERGSVSAQTAPDGDRKALSVFSPHAKAVTENGEFALSATPTSTRVDVKRGEVRVTRGRDSSAVTVRAGQNVVVKD